MLTPEQIQGNWETFINNIIKYIPGERGEALTQFYTEHEARLIMMPASHKKEYHSAYPGGYVDHVNRVVRCALHQYEIWVEEGVDGSTFTLEELIFSAINHDLGKLGDENHDSYIPQTDQWRKEKLGEDYTFNKELPFASVPDRSLFWLQSNGIQYSFNEMIAIQTHDGLFDEANKKYLMPWGPEQKPRTSLPYILHMADLMAARIEFEIEWLPKFSGPEANSPKVQSSKKHKTSQKALSSVGSPGLQGMLDNL
jgi:hypothetical protein